MNLTILEKDLNSNYSNVFGGDTELGAISASIHRSCIQSGNTLEKNILECVTDRRLIKGYRIDVKGKNIKPDLVYLSNNQTHYYEVKMGVVFDTKKSSAEIDCLNLLYNKHKGKNVKCFFVSWTAKTVDDIRKGLKLKTIPKNITLLTGEMFAKHFKFDVNTPIEMIKDVTSENIRVFFDAVYEQMEKYDYDHEYS